MFNFAASNLIIYIMDTAKFNRNFKLSANGKFVGVNNPMINTELLFHKLERLLRKENNNRCAPISYPVTMRVSGVTCKIYAY